jgi:hypothetical protein
MRFAVFSCVALSACTCDIHIDTGTPTASVVKVAPASKDGFEHAESNITDQQTLDRLVAHGWQVVDGPVTFQAQRPYHLKRPLLAEKQEKR